MKNPRVPNFFHDKSLFGLDIGAGSLKVMQLETNSSSKGKRKPKVIGYGFTAFDKSAQVDGVLVKPELVAKAAHDLFSKHLVGDITTRRVAMAIPAYRTFTRSIQMPKLSPRQLREAVLLEAEQYISMPIEDTYVDYDIIRESKDGIDVLIVAVPRRIINSYLDLGQLLGLEVVLIEPTLSSSGRLYGLDSRGDTASLLIDFGTLSSDINIFDKHVLVTGTVQGGGMSFTTAIQEGLGISQEEAGLIKTRYGLSASKRQKEIRGALEPTLKQIVREIQRMIRYYEEHYGNEHPVTQIVTLGGGANMPGLSEYLTDVVRLPVRHNDPWEYLSIKGLQPPSAADKPMYTTAAGLALIDPSEVFKS